MPGQGGKMAAPTPPLWRWLVFLPADMIVKLQFSMQSGAEELLKKGLTSSTTAAFQHHFPMMVSSGGEHLRRAICIYIDLFPLFLLLSVSFVCRSYRSKSNWDIILMHLRGLKGHSAEQSWIPSQPSCCFSVKYSFIIKTIALRKSDAFCEPSVLFVYLNMTDTASLEKKMFIICNIFWFKMNTIRGLYLRRSCRD